MVSSLRMPGRGQGHGGPAVGARAVRVAAHGVGGQPPPIPVHRVRSRVAPGHVAGRRAAGDAVATWPVVGAGSPGVPTPDTPVADALGVSWNTANDAVLAEGRRVLIDDPHRFDDVRVIGVDEHVWRHTRRGDKYVTVIIDLTPIRDGTGPARLLDMVAGRSKQAFKAWLAERDKSWRDDIEVVAMDGFTGFKTATTEELPEAVPGGPLPRRPSGRRRPGSVPAPGPASHPRAPWPHRRSTVCRATHPAHRRRPAHRDPA